MTDDDQPIGLLAIADQPRPDAAQAVASLTTLTSRPPVLLTGVNSRAAHRLADQLGIDEVHAGLLPTDKVDQVRRLEQAGASVLVLGDGVNDAPGLAAPGDSSSGTSPVISHCRSG